MKVTLHFLLIAVACFFAASGARAQFTTYTNSTNFFNAISASNYTQSFSSIPVGGFSNTNFQGNGFTINASGVSGLYGETYNVAPPTIRFLSTGGAPADELIFTFSSNVYAVGGWFLSAESTVNPGSFTATIVSGTGINVTNIFTNNTTTYENSFRGWVFETNIISLTLSTDPDNAGFPSAGDGITVAVPEPSTYALLGLAAAGLAGYALRRQRTLAAK
jgi:hypothetical protein